MAKLGHVGGADGGYFAGNVEAGRGHVGGIIDGDGGAGFAGCLHRFGVAVARAGGIHGVGPQVVGGVGFEARKHAFEVFWYRVGRAHFGLGVGGSGRLVGGRQYVAVLGHVAGAEAGQFAYHREGHGGDVGGVGGGEFGGFQAFGREFGLIAVNRAAAMHHVPPHEVGRTRQQAAEVGHDIEGGRGRGADADFSVGDGGVFFGGVADAVLVDGGTTRDAEAHLPDGAGGFGGGRLHIGNGGGSQGGQLDGRVALAGGFAAQLAQQEPGTKAGQEGR